MPINDDEIAQQFQAILGRAPNQSEIANFKRFGGTGQVDLTAADIGEILRGHPEARMKQLQTYGQAYGQELGRGDEEVLGKAQGQLLSDFARQGRSMTGSPYLAAFANAARDLALARQSKVADFYGGGLGDIFSETGAQAQQTRQFGLGQLEKSRQREFDAQDFYRQKDQFNDYLGQQNKANRNQALIGAGLGLAGAAAGGFFAPAGASGMGKLLGAQIGGQLGSSFGAFGR